ncbi:MULTISPECIES: sensor histidine kinase [unclassified Aureimonas]|uniref:sensor histidine kinase n=1 Tax=unclassified Aureimonas TaxID=2615206 RepID=UPI0006F7EBFC|nr:MULTISPECIES: HAMP domain-containing sensor histidine kinase [unclassified Aureimonas]KQT55256.1 hypothetical protein ASG62_10500 [Aureimonas sp. Leaf427]KQT71047.1 hypothetical protein ASG54_20885 [Aureimonas sp. Leaf460]
MAQTSEAEGATALAAALTARCEALVSPLVRTASERARQARVLGGLLAAALAIMLAAPLLWAAESSVQLAAGPLIASGLILGVAAALSATGRLDAVILFGAAAIAGAIALVAVGTDGLSSICLILLAFVPAGALSLGRRMLAGLSGAFGFLAFGGVAFADWAGVGRPLAELSGAADLVTVASAIAYGSWLARRAMRARKASLDLRMRDAAEEALADAALEEAVLRFSNEGALLSASPVASSLFAGSAPMTASRIVQAIHVTDRVRYLQAFADIRNGADRLVVRVRTASGEGRFADVEFDLRAHRGVGRKLVSVVAVARPAPPSADVLETLERALEAERESSLAKSRFLATVSHELRTPLNAIIGFSDVLDQEFFGGFEDPRQKEYVGHIRQSGEHLLGIVNGLLDVSKIEAGRYDLSVESVGVEELCRCARDTMAGEIARKGLGFELAIEPSIGRLQADRRACHQMLLNLLSNALKFTDAGSVTLTARREGRTIELAVRDTGIGIAAADLPRLGQPFVQLSSGTTRRYQGTGLGLSLVKGLAELHSGRMVIESQPGAGTTVRVFLPLDGPARIEHPSNPTTTVLALAHARKKHSHTTPDDDQARRTA